MNTELYFKNLDKDVKKIYELADEARAKGFDSIDKVEIPLARSLAEKVIGLIGTIYPQLENSGAVKRILELEKDYGKLDVAVAFKIAEEIAKQKFCQFKTLIEAIDAGIRVGFSYLTLGVVSSPIEGYTEIKLGKTRNNKEYFIASFSGPIRSAGTTASCMVLILIDYLRELFGYEKYDPNEEEIKRYITENTDYHERVTNLQYFPTENEMAFLAMNIPIQIDGDPTEKLEVSNYKNLPRVDSNFIRGGMCLIFSEGLAQKAKKGLRLLKSLKDKGFKSTGWDFLDDYVKLHEKRDKGETDDSPTYIKDLVAGRPVFGHPSRSGGFRFRYGRGRVSGFSATSMHPATMAICDNFIATGTQLKIEKPTKGTVVTVCDSVEGPIVKLKNGSVRKISDFSEAKKIYNDVEEIIYLGDILFPFGDLANRNSNLIKSGYVEEWWKLELQEKNKEKKIDLSNINLEDAVKISKEFGIPLHPSFIFYWTEISREQFLALLDWLSFSTANKKIILPYTNSDREKFSAGKRAMELLGIEHEVVIENVIVNEENSKALLLNLGIDFNILNQEKVLNEEILRVRETIKKLGTLENLNNEILKDRDFILSAVNELSGFIIKDKAGDFIGARMGRPEKAKLRKLIGSPNVLFPVGKEGGRLRSVGAACEEGSVSSAFPINYCEKCKKEIIYPVCDNCGEKTKKMYYCPLCSNKTISPCKEHEHHQNFCNMSINIKEYSENARKMLGLQKEEMPALVKGIRGTSSEGHSIEHLAKGILRAIYNLQVNKDGTIRFDATELPLISFKPKEVGTSIEKLRELGYDQDIHGEELKDENQILELMPHDIVLPSSSESLDERADAIFVRVAKFFDELLVRFYKLKPFYNIKKREDLIGHLGVCMAPHNCAGVICRFIGFSNTLGILASPYMHAAIRRDCDGDEMAVMLLGDVLLNFSRSYLPSHRGGTQDAPLVLNAKIDAGEVDDQILDFELTSEYPLELYRAAERREHSSKIHVNNVRDALRKGENPFINMGFTHDTTNFNDGVACSSYKLLGTMQEKVQHQMGLVEKIRAVDVSDTARLIIERHFIKDMRGNLRKFSTQNFRCVKCNEIVRRPPLSGVCPACGGKIIFTVNEGGIKKYLEAAMALANKYDLSYYIKQNLELIKRYIDTIFGKELEKQETMGRWF